jgi:hypothetical protein
MKATVGRIVMGLLAAGLVLALVVTFPFWKQPNLLPWLLFGFVLSYAAFLLAAALCHLVLRRFRSPDARHYFVVMLAVAFPLHLGVRIFTLRGYGDLYYARTQVIEHGHITGSGALLLVWESAELAALFAALFVLFWFIAVRPVRIHV